MGIGQNTFKSDSTEYSTPSSLVDPLIKEFDLTFDVCASPKNYKLPAYWNKEEDALTKDWFGNCWMNPPFDRSLKNWIKKAHSEAQSNGGNKVCLVPVRSNTVWWAETMKDAEIRFINGEVNFNDEERGLWMGCAIVIFGPNAKKGMFSFVDYRKIRKGENEHRSNTARR